MMYDVIVIGAGPAGLAAAVSAFENGSKKVALIERDNRTGGILNQCIHNGFGLHYFKEELTGPEYAYKFLEELQKTDVKLFLDSMVLEITKDKEVHIVNQKDGYQILKAKAIVLAMGCRERTRGAISTPGTRPSGVLTAGTAQYYANIKGYLVGKKVVILGSGDIGLIMARRMTLEGAKVLACVEVMPHSSGLTRNIVQCLDDFDIPLLLSHTVIDIKGEDKLSQVVVAKVDENRIPIKGTEMVFDCDTLLLSVGLIPENELTKQADIPIDNKTKGAVVYQDMQTMTDGIFACGNVLHVHDLVDFVTKESQKAGKFASLYSQGIEIPKDNIVDIIAKENVSYAVPQKFKMNDIEKLLEVFFRVNKIINEGQIQVIVNDDIVAKFKREHMAPGEMESIKIPVKLLENVDTDIQIKVVEV